MHLLLLLILAVQVNAVSIGVSPGRVNFQDLLQEGYAERTITITTNTDDQLNGHFNVRGDIAPWLSFEPNSTSFTVSRGDPYKLTIIVQPPADVQNGNYSGSIEFVTDTISGVAGRAGGIVKAAVTEVIGVEVSGIQNIECRAGGFRINDAEVGFPLELGATVINDGNVRINPTITMDFWGQYQENLITSDEVTSELVLPTTERRLEERVSVDLDVGQYWVDMGVEECGTSQLLTFSIVEEGGIADDGQLKSIFNKPWAAVGETVEFLVRFSNDGQRSVNARFKGSLRKDDEIVRVVETEEVIVPSGEETEFSIFHTPEEQGRYVLSGRVIYNKKLTFEKSSVLNVESVEKEEEEISLVPLALYVAIVITIIFLIRKIVRERKKKKPF